MRSCETLPARSWLWEVDPVMSPRMRVGQGWRGEERRGPPPRALTMTFTDCPPNVAVSGRGERMRASGPLQRGVGRHEDSEA